MLNKTHFLLAAALGLAAGSARAQTSNDHLVDLLQKPGSAGLGFVSRVEQSPYEGGDVRTDLLPLYMYEGERFYLSADRAGFKLYEEDSRRVDVYLARRLEGFPQDELTPELEGMAYREVGVDLGLGYRTSGDWGSVRASLLHDIGNISNGTEVRVGYSYDFHGARWVLRPDLTLAWRDANLNNYYYGVKPDEVEADRPAYQPGSGVNVSLGLYGSYQVWDNWRLLGGVSAQWLDQGIRDSPIVRDQLQPALFVGAVYDFGTAIARWDDDGVPLLVKVFYGRASGDGCHMATIMTLRCTSLDHDTPTSVIGVHLGRPFLEKVNGWPLDFHGYVGLTYHDENGFQPDIIQVDAYMKAFYYGFPWSHRVNTRFGFGYGLSWANRVPYTEVVSQAARDRPTSKLLNYLDPTIDVNVGDIFGADSWKDTYFGLGISHRSGIFASSRLLGSVDGGSNYIYAYLETSL
jgi:outer membrane protein